MSERQKYPPLIRDEIKQSLINQTFEQQTISDESLYRAQRLITSDAARFLDMRLRENDLDSLRAAKAELGPLSYVLYYAAIEHENVLHDETGERSRAQEDAIMFMHGSVYALEHVIYSRIDWIAREEQRARMAPYIHCFIQLSEQGSYTLDLLYSRAYELAKSSGDQEFINKYGDDPGFSSHSLSSDLLGLLTIEERRYIRLGEASSAPDSAPIEHQT
ncbi:MAG: hypothetical protein WBP12_00780 [Candidatus Saccharimonas sp.]